MGLQKVAFIGGTGVYKQSILNNQEELVISTRYGKVPLQTGQHQQWEIYFLARHGYRHSVPPHLVNYRANIAALKTLEIDAVIATAAVGSLKEDIPPGSRVVIDQFIDFTKGRPSTFYDGQEGEVVHTDFTQPYCPELRAAILRTGRNLGQPLIDGRCYLCTEGPRFETPA
ncbi:MAG TPA: MTAP family purine nucleoside phosphorylase, partial [Firmicutes bacterium]|nr:MTAP family purine nucleoside phosphorylase [Bacillota bacterium]